ncbi:DMT family transporter [Polycladidibacter stylochi]|uniref:DMT family transporter n=1 Tax=Polycladidibacter stylochi TaxID=1807766 RepID=UPI0008317836|nr:DMT family transporter [Pseudovibrio stylochi]
MTQNITRAAQAQNTAVKGMLLMLLAMMLLPVMDGTAKFLSAALPVVQISFGRFFFQSLIALFLGLFTGPGLTQIFREVTRSQLLRGVFLAVSSLLFFTAVKYLPLADAIATFFVQPMILTVLSAIVLKEVVGIRRWLAVSLGLLGVLIVIQPGTSVFSPYSLLPLAAATSFACYLLVTRRLAGSASLLGIQFSTGLAGTLILGSLLQVSCFQDIGLGQPVWPTAWQTLLLVVMGAISGLGHLLVVLAFNRAPASLLAPINYIEIISATLFGYFVFGEVPAASVWVGMAFLAAGGIYITHREHKHAKQLEKQAAAAEGSQGIA